MGMLRDAIGSALGQGQINNGFNSTFSFGRDFNIGHSNETSRYSSSPREHNFYTSTFQNTRSAEFSGEYALSQDEMEQPTSRQPRTMESRYSTGESSHAQNNTFNPPTDDLTETEAVWDREKRSLMPAPPPYEPQQTYQDKHSLPLIPRYHDQGFSDRIDRIQHRKPIPDFSFRPVVLPQIGYGQGQPFLRAYSDELSKYGITEQEFVQTVDAINIAIVPNPEVQIFQKAVGIAGWFVPGSAALGLMAGQAIVAVGAAAGHSSKVAQVLSRANIELFLPNGLEICIGDTNHVDSEVGFAPYPIQQRPRGLTNPEARLALYGNRIATISRILQPLERSGRSDPLAVPGSGIGQRSSKKKLEKAQKELTKGKSKDWDGLEGKLSWLMVRRATPDATKYWQESLHQSNIALERA